MIYGKQFAIIMKIINFCLGVKDELAKKTLYWLSERQEREAEMATCDDYMVNVLEILVKGKATVKPRQKGPNAGRYHYQCCHLLHYVIIISFYI